MVSEKLSDHFFVHQYLVSRLYLINVFRYPLGSIYKHKGWKSEILDASNKKVILSECSRNVYSSDYSAYINALIDIENLIGNGVM